MKKKEPKDQRPKVLSFRSSLDGLRVASKQSILWPCHAYTISIPQERKDRLNIFEETILKISEIEPGNTDRIVELTCLEKELVKFIQNRLKHLDLLNERYYVSEKGIELLNSWKNKDAHSIEYVTATVFVDLHSGKLLPYLHTEPIQYEKISSINKIIITLDLGSRGRSNMEKCRMIIPGSESHWSFKPDNNDIIKAIREFKKRYKKHALLDSSFNHVPPNIPTAEAISLLNEDPELVYLHCHALIQHGNNELLVTSGCGFGFSEFFARYLNSQNFDWITNFKSQALVTKVGADENNQDYLSPVILNYPEISGLVKDSKFKLSQVQSKNEQSSDNEYQEKQNLEDGIKKLYIALERGFREVVAKNSDNNSEDKLLLIPADRLHDYLITLAEKIGFKVNDENKALLNVKAGAIRQVRSGKIELAPLFAVSLVAADTDSNHPLWRLARECPLFLSTTLRLKRHRDPIEHGNPSRQELNEEILEKTIENTISNLSSMLPDFDRDLEELSSHKVDVKVNANQDRLKAEISLEKELGPCLLSKLEYNLKEQLLRAEVMLDNFSKDNAIEIIKCYASALQLALLGVVRDKNNSISSQDRKELALEKMVQLGFISSIDSIPAVKTVEIKNIDRVLRGTSTTLGAHLIALFMSCTDIELIKLHQDCPQLVSDVADILELRGHGSQNITNVNKEQLDIWRRKTLVLIEEINSIYNR